MVGRMLSKVNSMTRFGVSVQAEATQLGVLPSRA